MPGSNAKNVGLTDAPYWRRLDWLTNSPPLRSVRIQYALGSTFCSVMFGVKFHLPARNCGRFIEKSQSNVVAYVCANTMVRRFVVSAGSTTILASGKSLS